MIWDKNRQLIFGRLQREDSKENSKSCDKLKKEKWRKHADTMDY